MVLVVLSASVGGGIASARSAGGRPSSPAQTTEQLQQEKLRQEIRQLRLENETASGVRGFFSTYAGSLTALAGFLTALAAVGGLLLTIRQQSRLITDQQQRDREQRERDREQREIESTRHLDEQFAVILNGLGAEAEAVQAGAATSLFSFLRSEHEAYHRQVRLAVLANLKVQHPLAVTRILVDALEAALRTGPDLTALERDFSRAKLPRVDLSGLDLTEADLAFAQLQDANLTDTVLRRAKGFKVNLEKARICGTADLEAARLQEADCNNATFHNARLVSVHLENSTLVKAQFQRANLNAAHLEGADLRGARFEGASMADTHFADKHGTTAVLDDVALRSILRAVDWTKAHFAPEHRTRLEALESGFK